VVTKAGYKERVITYSLILECYFFFFNNLILFYDFNLYRLDSESSWNCFSHPLVVSCFVVAVLGLLCSMFIVF
jgi:hypothetical protein